MTSLSTFQVICWCGGIGIFTWIVVNLLRRVEYLEARSEMQERHIEELSVATRESLTRMSAMIQESNRSSDEAIRILDGIVAFTKSVGEK